MNEPGTPYVVLRDDTGGYYLLPESLLQSVRVADNHVPAVEAALRGEDNEVGGFIFNSYVFNPSPGLAGQYVQNSSFTQSRLSQAGIIVVGGRPKPGITGF